MQTGDDGSGGQNVGGMQTQPVLHVDEDLTQVNEPTLQVNRHVPEQGNSVVVVVVDGGDVVEVVVVHGSSTGGSRQSGAGQVLLQGPCVVVVVVEGSNQHPS